MDRLVEGGPEGGAGSLDEDVAQGRRHRLRPEGWERRCADVRRWLGGHGRQDTGTGTSGGWSPSRPAGRLADNATMTAPPFALPVPDPRESPAGATPVVVGARERARRRAALAALGAAATAATLAVATAVVVFEAGRRRGPCAPGFDREGLSPEGLRELAGLPGPVARGGRGAPACGRPAAARRNPPPGRRSGAPSMPRRLPRGPGGGRADDGLGGPRDRGRSVHGLRRAGAPRVGAF